ncbi:HAD family hydrolase [Motiliproteus sp.]|uniref:HAD family hydrolase n=1 Tax=Motiliproteus sp. TaxID=1898955 RepID=UPI003BA9598B
MSRTIKLISFDLDDTLWAVGPVIVQANLTLYRWLDTNAPAFTERYQLEDFDKLRRIVVSEQPDIAHSVTAIRLAVLTKGLLDSGYDNAAAEQLAEAAFEVFLAARNQVELFQHAQQMLIDLSANYRLVALSNGNADVEKVGLGEFFEFGLNADQVGKAKPDPLMFEQMLERAGVVADEVLHIGDHPDHDIRGAQDCGLHTLWVNFSGKPWPEGPKPDLEVRCLSEIPGAIARFTE